MFEAIKGLFKKSKKKEEVDPLDLKFEILEDVTFENEVAKSNEQKAKVKDTKETKSSLTFGE
jgi:hypothetical protein|tara:strand:- start:192 stop:377 length:186 start_codon:yes stop_codon:yes gene_type:complete